MILWVLLLVALCGLLPTHTKAEIVHNFNGCSTFFYRASAPAGFSQTAVKICQRMTPHSGFFYATLYSKDHRIPYYSAYTFDSACNNQDGRKDGDWFVEPQLSPNIGTRYMDKESNYNPNTIKANQAINADYKNTGYDRGHLNPNSFQCEDGRVATFTLTNSAPMDPCFNRIQWKNAEAAVKQVFRAQDSGTAYLVTGTVLPDQDHRIPRQWEFDVLGEREFNRVTVPSHVWTAVCYDHPSDRNKPPSDRRRSFSFGLLGVNEAHGNVNIMTVAELTQELRDKYRNNNLKIFEDDCSFSNPQFQGILLTLYQKIQPSLNNQLVMSEQIKNIFQVASRYSGKRKWTAEVKQVNMQLTTTTESWAIEYDTIKRLSGMACLRTGPSSGSLISIYDGDVRRKRQALEELVCRLVPEKLDGCTGSCLYNDEAAEYLCSSRGQTKPCSPIYSDVTVDKEACKKDHTCGKYTKDYYWCNREKGGWNYCSPPPPLRRTISGKSCRVERNCAKYDKSYFWCETYDGETEKC